MATVKLLPKLIGIAIIVGSAAVGIDYFLSKKSNELIVEQKAQVAQTDSQKLIATSPPVVGVVNDGDKKIVQEQTIEIPQSVNSPLHMNAGLEKLMSTGSKK